MLEILALSFGVAGAGLASGGLTLALQWKKSALLRLIALGAGALLGAGFLHVLPEAIEISGRNAAVSALLGFLFLYVAERFSFTHPCEGEICDFHKLGLLAYVGIAIHNLIDGVALGTGAFLPAVTIPVFLALVVHKIPTSLALASILIGGHFPKRTIFGYLTVISMAIPLGAILAFVGIRHFGVSSAVPGHLLGFSAGTFLYIGASDLLPEIHKDKDERTSVFISVLAGIGLMAALAAIL